MGTRHWHLHNTSVVHAATMPSVVGRPRSPVLVLAFIAVFACIVHASKGDRLPEFKQCLAICKTENCGANGPHTPIPLLHRLMLWNCASECDYTCQHIITNRRLDTSLPVVQFHGKWPFHRFLGMQEPFSVLFSLGNLFAHYYGLRKLRQRVPASYTLRPFCIGFAYVGIASWVFSAIFHSRDFQMTEELDYFAAGLNVLYGTYLSAVRAPRVVTPLPATIHDACRLPQGDTVGLYLQHGGQCGCWHGAECAVVLVQYRQVPQIQALLDYLAWSCCGMDHAWHEHGAL